MDIVHKEHTQTKSLKRVTYGSFFRWDDQYWILADTYPNMTIVNVDDGSVHVFEGDEHRPEVDVFPNAKIQI